MQDRVKREVRNKHALAMPGADDAQGLQRLQALTQ